MKPVEEKIASSELSNDLQQMSDATDEAVLSSENPGESRTSCRIRRSADFRENVCKTVCPMLSDRCLSACLSVCQSCLSVCSVGGLQCSLLGAI